MGGQAATAFLLIEVHWWLEGAACLTRLPDVRCMYVCVSEDEDGEEWQAVVNKCEGLVHAAHVDCQASATLCLKYLAGSG